MGNLDFSRINFTANAGFSISSIFICLCILFSYFLKNKTEKTEEKTIYFILVLWSIILLSILEIIYVIYYLKVGVDGKYAVSLYRGYSTAILLATYFSWAYVVTYRLNLLPNKDDKKIKIRKFLYFILTIAIELVIAFLVYTKPVRIYANYGLLTFDSVAITVILIYILFSTLLFVFLLYFRNPNLTKRDLYPSIVSLIIISILLIHRLVTGIDINIETFQLTVFAIGIFFTIENQDIKLLNETRQKQKSAHKTNESQKEFLEDMSHEIRTPMYTILGLDQLLKKETKLTEDEVRTDMQRIHDSSVSLLRLTHNIMDYAYTISNKIEVEDKEYKFQLLLAELNNNVSVRLANTNIKFDFNIIDQIPKKLMGDREKITKILFNIICNIIRSDNGQIVLNIKGSKKENDMFQLTFETVISETDMNKQLLDFNFEELMNLDYNSTIDSSILGLIVAKKLSEILNGKLEVYTDKEKEIKYTLTIEQKIVDETLVGNEIKDVLVNSTNVKLDLSSKNILIVENSYTTISIMKRLLDKYNINIDICATGKDAIEQVQEKNYDLIFIDQTLPDYNGTQTLIKIKKVISKLPPVVAILEDLTEEYKQKYYNEGFYDSISKPINYIELNKVLYELFDEQNSLDEQPGGDSNV